MENEMDDRALSESVAAFNVKQCGCKEHYTSSCTVDILCSPCPGWDAGQSQARDDSMLTHEAKQCSFRCWSPNCLIDGCVVSRRSVGMLVGRHLLHDLVHDATPLTCRCFQVASYRTLSLSSIHLHRKQRTGLRHSAHTALAAVSGAALSVCIAFKRANTICQFNHMSLRLSQ